MDEVGRDGDGEHDRQAEAARRVDPGAHGGERHPAGDHEQERPDHDARRAAGAATRAGAPARAPRWRGGRGGHGGSSAADHTTAVHTGRRCRGRASERDRSALGAAACAAGFVLVALLVSVGHDRRDRRGDHRRWCGPELHDAARAAGAITELGSTWAVIGVGALVLLRGLAAGRPPRGAAGALAIAHRRADHRDRQAPVRAGRPDFLEPIIVEVGFSFPSGHAANADGRLRRARGARRAAAVAGRLRVAIDLVLGAIVFAVGLSRVWLGVHYPTDVVAGWARSAARSCSTYARSPSRCRLSQPRERLTRIQQRNDPIDLLLAEHLLGAGQRREALRIGLDDHADLFPARHLHLHLRGGTSTAETGAGSAARSR